jgi:Rrf2 family transcriptional regulator, nitric oxide-sensitive transcriptional repressor
MRLTQFSDYALRTVLYLGVHDSRLVPLAEVARAYGISYHHLVKVGALLVNLGVVESVRGRGGGLRLALSPAEVNVGWLVRRTEPDFHLVECFDRETDTCPITPVCGLRHALLEAKKSFLETLDRYTLEHFLASPGRQKALIQLWQGVAAS